MIERLEAIDQELFVYLNGLHSDFWDPIMAAVSDKLFWIPVYLLLFYLVYRKYSWRGLGFFTLAAALTVLCADQLSSSVFKPFFARYRPCNNLDLVDIVHTVNGRCGRGFSFISGHATNYFAIAVLCARTLRHRTATIILLLWAALIAYSRVYLGVHYPADITLGAIVGTLIGLGIYRLLGSRIRSGAVS